MKTKIYIYSLLLACICSCKTKENDHFSKEYVFNKSSCHDANEVISNLKIKPIYLSDSIIVRENSAFAFDGDFYYIYAKDGISPVYRFNGDGEFVNQIGHIGNGPGEFTALTDFSLNKADKAVEILSPEFVYKYAFDGDFIEKRAHKLSTFSFAIDENQNYWFYLGNNNNNYKIVRTDKDFDHKGEYLNEKSNLLPMSEQNFGKGPILTFRESLNNKLYQIISSEFIESYKIDFGDYALPADLYDIPPMKVIESLQQKNYAIIYNYQENERYVYLHILLNTVGSQMPEIYYWFIRKKDDKDLLLKLNPESMESRYLFNPQLLTENDDLLFLGVISTENISSEYDKNPSIIAISLNELIK